MQVKTAEENRTVEVEDNVFLTQLASGDRMSIQHLRIEPGGEVPQHSHPHEQVGFVFQGEQTFILENGETVPIGPGESYRLESDEVHGAVNRGDDTLIAVDIFSPPRPNPNWLDD